MHTQIITIWFILLYTFIKFWFINLWFHNMLVISIWLIHSLIDKVKMLIFIIMFTFSRLLRIILLYFYTYFSISRLDKSLKTIHLLPLAFALLKFPYTYKLLWTTLPLIVLSPQNILQYNKCLIFLCFQQKPFSFMHN